MLNPHPHLQCRGLKLGRAIPLPALRALVACIGRTFTFFTFQLSWFVRRSVCGNSPRCRPFHPVFLSAFPFIDSCLWTYSRTRIGDRPTTRRVPTRQMKTKKTQIYFSVPRGNQTLDPPVCDVDTTGIPLGPCCYGNWRCYVLRIPPTDTCRFRPLFNKWGNVSVTLQ